MISTCSQSAPFYESYTARITTSVSILQSRSRLEKSALKILGEIILVHNDPGYRITASENPWQSFVFHSPPRMKRPVSPNRIVATLDRLFVTNTPTIQVNSNHQTHLPSPPPSTLHPSPTHESYHTNHPTCLYFHSTHQPRMEDRSSCSHFHNQFHSTTPNNASPTSIDPDFHCCSVTQTSPTPNSDSRHAPTPHALAHSLQISYASTPALPNHCSASPPSFPQIGCATLSSCPPPR